MIVLRGQIFKVDLGKTKGSEQGGSRPVLIIQNNIGNKRSPTTICAPITSKLGKASLPTHIRLDNENAGIEKNSIVLLEQIITVDKTRLGESLGYVSAETIEKVNTGLKISLGLL